MKLLKRLLLINWQHYSKEIIDYEMINFKVGKTGSGKSTLIDALQLVILGDTSGNFFNKAANDKSIRTMTSYLFGEIGEDGDVEYEYLRNGRFTSYIALEFEDTVRKQKFVTGIACDCHLDRTYEHQFFVIRNQGFPQNHFINNTTGAPYTISELKSFLKGWVNNAYEFPITNTGYRDITQAMFGNIKDKYRFLFKTAVPFKPISDIGRFITESICDVKSIVNIEHMQHNIRQYKRLEQDAKYLEKRIKQLKEIAEDSQQLEHEEEKHQKQSFIIQRAEFEKVKDEEQISRQKIEAKNQLLAQNTEDITNIGEEIKRNIIGKGTLEHERRTTDVARKAEELQKRLFDLKQHIESLQTDIQRSLQQLHHYGRDWYSTFLKLRHVNETIEEMVRQLQNITAEESATCDFKQHAEEFKKFQEQLQCEAVECKQNYQGLKAEIEGLEQTIRDLKKGIKPYPQAVVALKQKIKDELGDIEIDILADVLEIKNERWRNTIEGYLDKQKFYLLVDEAHFQQVLIIYQEQKSHDVGLVDIGKLKQHIIRVPLAHALSEEITTTNEQARLYIDYLLGQVVKCGKVTELRQFPTAITPDCMLYKGFVARKINPKRYANPYIGRQSITVLLENKERLLVETTREYNQVLNEYRILSRAATQKVMSDFEAEDKNERFKAGLSIPTLQATHQQLQFELDGLDLSYLTCLDQRIKQLERKIEELNETSRNLFIQNGSLKITIQNETEKCITLTESMPRLSKQLNDSFPEAWQMSVGEPEFKKVSGNRSWEQLQSTYENARYKTETAILGLQSKRTSCRIAYNTDYKMSHDVMAKDNEAYDKELAEFSDYRLPEYLNQIKDSKEKAYNQFKDDFLAKLKSNIEALRLQLKELNDALKQSTFGTDTYRFVMNPRPEYRDYYNMIMDPMLMDVGAYNLMSVNFNQKYEREISELFQRLIYNDIEVTAAQRSEYEKAIEKYTDYKTYLVFDLIVTNAKGKEQRLSKTLLKKSGGETQVPFYISMLASFSQVCRIRHKNNNTIRLIILDEAFSKMDGERIQECIRLLKRFGLQAIFSAPTDKIPDIAPLVDKNILVIKGEDYAETHSFSAPELEALMEEIDVSEMGA